MTGNTWTELPDGAVDQSSPVTDVLLTALRDNPKGIAERATGAPIVRIAQPEFLTGSGTWTVPDGVTAFKVTVVGAGGAGGSADNAGPGTLNAAGGGGAGGIAVKWYNNVSPGDSYSYAAAPATTASGANGGSSTFDTVTANGGAGGINAKGGSVFSLSGNGGSSSGGDINGSGGAGQHASEVPFASGAGASCQYGVGGYFRTGLDKDGIGASGYGAGGGGATNSGSTLDPGGDGAPGVIIIEY